MFKGLLITVHVHARFEIHVNTRFTVMVFAVCLNTLFHSSVTSLLSCLLVNTVDAVKCGLIKSPLRLCPSQQTLLASLDRVASALRWLSDPLWKNVWCVMRIRRQLGLIESSSVQGFWGESTKIMRRTEEHGVFMSATALQNVPFQGKIRAILWISWQVWF